MQYLGDMPKVVSQWPMFSIRGSKHNTIRGLILANSQNNKIDSKTQLKFNKTMVKTCIHSFIQM